MANEVFLVLSGILSLEEIKSRPKIDGDTQHSHKSILKLDGNSEPSDGDLKVFMDEIATLQESTSSPLKIPITPKLEPTSFFSSDTDDPHSSLTLQHRLVHNEGGRALTCLYCKLTGCKTDKGYSVRSYYRCHACHAALCSSGSRNCYNLFHEFLKKTRNPDLQWTKFTFNG